MFLNSGHDREASHQQFFWGSNNVEALLDDVSRTMATSNLSRRTSRASSTHGHIPGTSMRGVVKTIPNSSANSSPRGSILNRRKTLMGDAYRRRPILRDQTGTASAMHTSSDGLQGPQKASRPVSWHPSSQMAPQFSYDQYSVPQWSQLDVPPPPIVYSNFNSPKANFSPFSQQVINSQQQHPQYPQRSYVFPSAAYDTMDNVYPPYPQEPDLGAYPLETPATDLRTYTQSDWDNFVTNGFISTTSPPTPENFLPIQHPSPAFEISEPTPYTLDDPEDGEEPLIGMGLYDAPEKSPASDPHLDRYRAQMMVQLLGPSQMSNEPTGKGLKLEETWNPPPSDDGEDDSNDDEDEDAEGSVVDEELKV